MRTVGRRYALGVKGDYRRDCDYCGIEWHRSQMIKDAAGFYACPDDQKGHDVLTLTRINAESAGTAQPVRPARGRW